jgi:hypothetical protein
MTPAIVIIIIVKILITFIVFAFQYVFYSSTLS